MKKILTSLFHFMGGIYLAISLISFAAIAVIAGTFLESKTGSHLLAASRTYESPFFLVLLFLFFVNILFSALRRWPFKTRHIPFLITHLGLLMIIGGTMIKNRYGLQGQLTVWEGSGNQQALLPHSHALLIQSKEESQKTDNLIALNSFRPTILSPFHLPQLKCKLIGYSPHVKEVLDTWIKGPKAYIAGFPPIPVEEWTISDNFPEATPYQFPLSTIFPTWSILAIRTSDPGEAVEQAYLQNAILQLKKKGEAENSLSLPLREALTHPFPFMEGLIHISLELSILEKGQLPHLNLTWKSQNTPREEVWTIPLQGQDALIMRPASTQWSEPSFTTDLTRPNPLIVLIADEKENTYFLAFDSYGRVHSENFRPSQLQSLMSYENGFGGYGVHAVVPIPSFPASREDKEKGEAYALTNQLRQALLQHPPLAPPLQCLKEACEEAQVDFPSTFVQFLTDWNNHPGFLYTPTQSIQGDIEKAFNTLNRNKISKEDQQAIQWTIKLMNQLEYSRSQGENPIHVLEHHRWPLIEELKQNKNSDNTSLLNLIAMQIHSLAGYLPPLDFPAAPANIEKSTLLAAYFRSYGIDYRSLLPYRGDGKENFDGLEHYWKDHEEHLHLQQTIVFETPLSHRIVPEEAPSMLEDQRPGIVLEVEEGQHKQTIALLYDPSGGGLKWPILNGKYMIRLQPNLRELPYRIRLRQARQISYPQSQQVYSYESDLLISEKEKVSVEHTLSMNKVYETWDGYRFYLAGIGSSTDATLKRIQLAVNYDPAKYFLTYPGALFVFLGTISLFWFKRK